MIMTLISNVVLVFDYGIRENRSRKYHRSASRRLVYPPQFSIDHQIVSSTNKFYHQAHKEKTLDLEVNFVIIVFQRNVFAAKAL